MPHWENYIVTKNLVKLSRAIGMWSGLWISLQTDTAETPGPARDFFEGR